MNLFIELKDGKPINHPILESNLRTFFPKLNVNIPPKDFARFVRKEKPAEHPENMHLDRIEYVLDKELTEKNKTPTYTDSYVFRPYTNEEREELINEFKKLSPNEKDWVFDDETMTLIPPIPKPTDGKNYVWIYPEEGESQGRWVEVDDIRPDTPEIVASLRALKELKEEMGISDEALDEATKNIILSLITDNK